MRPSAGVLAAIGSFVCMALGMSAVFMGSFPVFLEAVSASLGGGLSVFPQIVMLASVTGAVCNPLAGRLIDRIGVRWPVLCGTACLSGGLFALSLVEATGPLFWLAGVLIGIGSALGGPLAHIKVVSSWFDRRRGLVMGMVVAMAPMLSQAGVAPLSRWLLEQHGWRDSYRLFALAVLVLSGAATLAWVRTRPGNVVVRSAIGVPPPPLEGLSARQAFATRTFWTLTIAECLVASALIGTQAHAVAWLRQRGVSGEVSVLLLSVQSLASLVGSLVVGAWLDRVRSRRATVALYLLPVFAMLAMILANSTVLLGLAAALMGLAMSTAVLLLPYLVTRFFGQRASAEILGLAFAFTMTAIGCGPLLIGLAFDATGGYAAPMAGAVLALMLAVVLMATLGPRAFQLPMYRGVGVPAAGPIAAPKGLS